jgi:hypothetical protein
MKGMYLTDQGKQELEAKIAKLEVTKKDLLKRRKELHDKYKNTKLIYEIMSANSSAYSYTNREQKFYKETLGSATILPIETESSYIKYVFDSSKKTSDKFSNGVILQPKQ